MFNKIMIEPIASFSFSEITSVDQGLGGIYAIEHLDKPGFYYIGSAVNFYSRWSGHKCGLIKAKHPCSFLWNVSKKYGFESLVFSILETVDNRENLIKREQFFIDQFSFDALYNSCPVAGSNLGFKHSEESKNKMSKTREGAPYCKRRPKSEEEKRRISKKLSQAKSKLTDESAILIFQKHSQGVKIRKLSQEFNIGYDIIWCLIRGKTFKYLNLLESK